VLCPGVRLVLLVTVAAGLGAAGCMSGSSSPGTSAQPASGIAGASQPPDPAMSLTSGAGTPDLTAFLQAQRLCQTWTAKVGADATLAQPRALTAGAVAAYLSAMHLDARVWSAMPRSHTVAVCSFLSPSTNRLATCSGQQSVLSGLRIVVDAQGDRTAYPPQSCG
jgi:hypothetical protein